MRSSSIIGSKIILKNLFGLRHNVSYFRVLLRERIYINLARIIACAGIPAQAIILEWLFDRSIKTEFKDNRI